MALGAVLVVLTVGAAVFGGGDDGQSAGAGEPVMSDTITIDAFEFQPGDITVQAGTEITIVNDDNANHTVTADDGESFDTDNIEEGGATTTITIDEPGAYPYHCDYHPTMTGTITVVE